MSSEFDEEQGETQAAREKFLADRDASIMDPVPESTPAWRGEVTAWDNDTRFGFGIREIGTQLSEMARGLNMLDDIEKFTDAQLDQFAAKTVTVAARERLLIFSGLLTLGILAGRDETRDKILPLLDLFSFEKPDGESDFTEAEEALINEAGAKAQQQMMAEFAASLGIDLDDVEAADEEVEQDVVPKVDSSLN